MSEERDMLWALEMAIIACNIAETKTGHDDFNLAANMLRNGGPAVEKSSQHKLACCPSCGKILRDGYYCPTPYNECNKSSFYAHKGDRDLKVFFRKWTEQEKIQIVTEKSKPTFEPASQ